MSDFPGTFFLACFPFGALLEVKVKGSAFMFKVVEEGAELPEDGMTLEIECESA